MIANERKIFCIIPAYNEQEKIARAIADAARSVDRVVVVDDGSQDNTRDEARKAGASLIRHILNRGQGAALRTGNHYALEKGADLVVHFDGDGQFEGNDIENMARPILKDECDIVFGSRFLDKRTNMPFLKRRIIFPAARSFNRIFGIRTSDPQSGFRAMNREALGKIKIDNDGSAHCSEILMKAHRLGLRIKEVPIKVHYDRFGQGFFGGKGRGSGAFRIVMDLFMQKLIK